ncbi:MAG: outer membrane beta-barrel protein [Mediterranea sp.]|nr:outer membrane beta-barrel protein [Mediterranea sp.]
MKRISVIGVLLCVFAISTFAQNKVIAVSGRVVESDTKNPAAQATLQLLSLPDSAYAAGIASSNQGWFTLPKVKAGKYVLKISYIGYTTKFVALQLANNAPDKKLGTLALSPDVVMLKEAVVTAEAPQVAVKEDTLEYNSSAYRTPQGAMLEDLVKKLPGAEISDDGTVKINGKEVKKIMVDGKEFFGGDVKTGLQNLPVDMIDKLKAYDKKSDLARITGIDDGNEETVLDLKVKKGMNQGWFGNADLSAGTEHRYNGKFMLNRFVDHNQFSLIGGANNVNDRGYGWGGGGNGLTARKTIGANFATETEKLELGGSVRYNYTGTDRVSTGSSALFQTPNNKESYSNTNGINKSSANNVNANFRMEWKPDTLTNIIFQPNFSYGKNWNSSDSKSGTFKHDPYGFVPNPNDYLDLNEVASEDPFDTIRVSRSNNRSYSNSNSLSANASLQLNRRLNDKGRNITFRGTFSYGNGGNEQFSDNKTVRYLEDDSLFSKRYINTPTRNLGYSAQATYSEPIWRNTYLQFSYQFTYNTSKSDKNTYDLMPLGWEFDQPLPDGYLSNRVDTLSKYAKYDYYNHNINVGLRFNRESYQLSTGVSFQPQNSKLDYNNGRIDTTVTRHVFNFAPNVDFRYKFSKTSQLRIVYRGNASQPSMESMLPAVDNSDPQNITQGNPGLKPSFTHSVRVRYNTYNQESQRGIFTFVNFSAIQNSISNRTEYNDQTAATITMPKNINGNWNASAMFGMNTALRNKKFTIGTFSRGSYNNNVAYSYNRKTKIDSKVKTTNLNLSERLNGTYRNDWLEFGLNTSINYTWERSQLNPSANQEPYTYTYGASTNIFMPWGMSISTDITSSNRQGYTDASLNRTEWIWNAQLSQSFLKGTLNLSLEFNDILKQQSNISRSLTAEGRNISENNGVFSYGMLHLTYRLYVFNGKGARQGQGMDRGRGGFDHGGRPDFRRGGGGGFGGGRRF